MELEIKNTDLYITGYIVDFPKDGEGLLLRRKLNLVGSEGDIYHTYVAGERLDQLAWRYYGGQIDNASKLWWVIADANNIFNPFEMDDYVGKPLLVPDIQKVLLQI